MTSCDSKKNSRIKTLDRISQLPEPLILDILSRLPLEDSARASVLSKTWERFCSLYPILHFDQNIIALRISDNIGCEPPFSEIRDVFFDCMDYQLNRLTQFDLPIRKLSLTVELDDDVYYSRVDKWLEFIKKTNVENLCIFVEIVGFLSAMHGAIGNALYEFPVSLLASKNLRSVYLQGCMLRHETFAGEVSFSSLQRLCLSHVYIGQNAMDSLARCCQGVETLLFDSCTMMLETFVLSKFPKLKKALIEPEDGFIDYVDIVGTNLECFKFISDSECRIIPDACAGIREFTLLRCSVSHPNLFKDLTATFPLIEEIEVDVLDSDMLKAASNVLRKLKFVSVGLISMEEVYIDCPNLTLLDFWTYGVTNLYVNCPKLRVFRYNGNIVPEQPFFKSIADLEESSCGISIQDAYDISWFVKLRAFLELIMASTINVSLRFSLPMETFKPEELTSVQASPPYNVNLNLTLRHDDMQHVPALVDAVLWIIRPITLTVDYRDYNLAKYLCENLVKKSENKISGEQICEPCWLQQIEDFEVECSSDISNIKQNLVSLPEQCRAIANRRDDYQASLYQICFKFNWCYN